MVLANGLPPDIQEGASERRRWRPWIVRDRLSPKAWNPIRSNCHETDACRPCRFAMP
jgi:hypothetical protein